MAAPTPAEIRAARAFLQRRGVRPPLQPRPFAAAAKEMNMGFRELLAYIRRLYAGGQGQQQAIHEMLQREVSR